jgi:hypothetical protein
MLDEVLRGWLRKQALWIRFQDVRKEGWSHAWKRSRVQPLILKTPPIPTAKSGPVELRVLTWKRDWINLLWALKSFYHYAQVDYPLYIHDGGLLPDQAQRLREHFPHAFIISRDEIDPRVEELLSARGLKRSLAYRRLNPSTRKIWDFFAFSQAQTVVTIDSDIVFFRKPELLLVPPEGVPRNRYNKDSEYWYSMPIDEIEACFGIRPPERINSGLAVIRVSSVDFDAIERWLHNETLFANRWVTEQTLHALVSTVFGIEHLPSTYLVSTTAGIPSDTICKHYPGFYRPFLYEEGMTKLVTDGFLGKVGR